VRQEVLRALIAASAFVRGIVARGLLAVVYVVVVPFYAIGMRLAARRPGGWHDRLDADVGSVERLRRPF
jgi:hypothetical protein